MTKLNEYKETGTITAEIVTSIGVIKHSYNLTPRNLVTVTKLVAAGKKGSNLKIDGSFIHEDITDKIEELAATPPSLRKWGDERRISATEFCERYLLQQQNKVTLPDFLRQTKKQKGGYINIEFFETLPFSVYSNSKNLAPHELRDIYRKYSAFLRKYIYLQPQKLSAKLYLKLKEKGVSKNCLKRYR